MTTILGVGGAIGGKVAFADGVRATAVAFQRTDAAKV